MVRGPATLRYGSQAIGGVVNASQQPHPRGHPAARHRGRDARRPQLRRRRRATAPSSVRPAPATSSSTPTPSRARADDYDTPRGRQVNSCRRQRRLFARRLLRRSRTASSASPTRRFDSTLLHPRRSRPPSARTASTLEQNKVPARANGASTRIGHRGDPLLVRRTPTTSTTRCGSRCRSLEIGSTLHSTASTKRASRSSISPSGPRSASCAALSACRSVRPRPAGARASKASLLDPAQYQQRRRLPVRGAAGDEEAALAGRRPHRGRRGRRAPASIFPPSSCRRPMSPISRGQAHLHAEERQRRLPLRAAAGVVARLTGAARGARAGRRRALLQGRARGDRHLRDRQPLPHHGDRRNTFELGFKRAKGDFRFDASVYYTELRRLHLQALHRREVRRRLRARCGSRHASSTRSSIRSSDATFYGAELLAELDIGRIWRGVWGIDGQYDFVHATFEDGDGNVPQDAAASRWAAASTIATSTGCARINLLHAFEQDEIGDVRHADPGLHPAQRRPRATRPSSIGRPAWCPR